MPHLIESYLMGLANKEIAEQSQRFFKTGPGQYGEGDQFLGIRVPVIREAVNRFSQTDLAETEALLQSPWHEVRLFVLLLWVRQFQRGDDRQQRAIFQAFLRKMAFVNNWDLVDTTVPHLVGGYLSRHPEEMIRLEAWVLSENLWYRRIAILATFHFIRQGQFATTLGLAERLLADREDLIHKAVGWMLREVGKRDQSVLVGFLQRHYSGMPRTMLRYAIERLPEALRQDFLQGRL